MNLFKVAIPFKRAHHEMVYGEQNKCVLIIGGSTPLNNGQSYKFFNDIWQYNGYAWKKIAVAGVEMSGIRLAYNTSQNKIYSYGGFTSDNQPVGQLRVLENNDWNVLSDFVHKFITAPMLKRLKHCCTESEFFFHIMKKTNNLT